jgi:hypothetical protein
MKLIILLAVLFLAGFFMQKSERKPVEKKPRPTSQSVSMIFTAPSFDAYNLKAGEAPVSGNANGKSWDKPGVQKELIVLKKISKEESVKDSLIWERNNATDFVMVNQKKFADAEKICQLDAEVLPEYGWALLGFYNSLKGKNKMQEAEGTKKRFEQALKWSDLGIEDCGLY